ncbi:MAG: hypothetical protein QXP53_01665 [Candidatus Pacearchaeota archaeon]
MPDKKITRQILHMIIGTLIIIGLILVERPLSLVILFLSFLAAVLLSLLARKIKIPIIICLTNKLGKKDEEKFPGKGLIFLLAGCLLTAKLFPLDIALASIAVLTFGDPTTCLARKALTKKPYKKDRVFKGFAGIIGLVVSFFVAFFFVSSLYAAVAAIAGMLAESIAIKVGQNDADDNLIVPLASGTVLYLLRFLIKI